MVKNEAGLKLKHLVGLCVYKEPLDLLMDTIDSIASQPNASEKITCLVGMEGGTPDKEEVGVIENRYFDNYSMFRKSESSTTNTGQSSNGSLSLSTHVDCPETFQVNNHSRTGRLATFVWFSRQMLQLQLRSENSGQNVEGWQELSIGGVRKQRRINYHNRRLR